MRDYLFVGSIRWAMGLGQEAQNTRLGLGQVCMALHGTAWHRVSYDVWNVGTCGCGSIRVAKHRDNAHQIVHGKGSWVDKTYRDQVMDDRGR